MQWYNEPSQWREQDGKLIVTADPDTDAWRVTRHNFIKDDAHFYYREVTGDFTATVKITGDYTALYDQAGLMVRESELVWLKCGIEYVNDAQKASVVVTRDFSDWSVVPLEDAPRSIWIRVQRIGSAVEVSYARTEGDFLMMREAYLSEVETLQVGMMCAAPKGAGFAVTFEDFSVA